MTTINQPQYPVGSRLLVAWMVKSESITPSGWIAVVDAHRSTAWTENDQIGEVQVVEYSPSGKHVRLSSPGNDDYMHGHSGGWYPIERIVVKETLEPKATKQGDAP